MKVLDKANMPIKLTEKSNKKGMEIYVYITVLLHVIYTQCTRSLIINSESTQPLRCQNIQVVTLLIDNHICHIATLDRAANNLISKRIAHLL